MISLEFVPMQNDTVSMAAYGALANAQSLQEQQNGLVFSNSLYSSIFSPDTNSLYQSRHLMQQHQDTVNRNNLCLTRLRAAAREVEALRQENANLRSVNRELNKHVSLLIQASVKKHFGSPDYDKTTPFEVVNMLSGLLDDGGGREEEEEEEDEEEETPSSFKENVEAERVTLPKSISVRSNGYLKMSHGAAKTLPQTASPLTGKQKVYVRASKKEEPLEMEVYNQGMFKTELCNKWQETGACPYGDHCQFAHGIGELRPVIRHPRYKTEVCRMVLAGDMCPYGHRCHFRHALSEEEKFMGRLKPRAIRLN
ncbi:zf-CCCH domain-containing protein [Cephalotus follicularis]|uniref:Zf-CCCH domain-containing protein n=1 Tax=Cephalotus follicularis TaxID=3775 RepID=A0A1Q3CTZ5_CEPFO|nr:zf-CCCH domain-containing protein [Cephalotus follicularis]